MKFILNWIWPKDRCRTSNSLSDWHSDYLQQKSLGIISRTADGRFVLRDSGLTSRAGSISNYSSSDDGGFLPRRQQNRASWRKPLIGYPSQLSLRSDGSGQSARGGLANFFGGFVQPRFVFPKPVYTIQAPLTPRFRSSSPTSSNAVFSPWTPLYTSDLSSVRQSSVERSYNTPPFVQLRSIHERYSQELPSLRAIHEEAFNNQFIPVHPITASPVARKLPTYQNTMRPRARLLPRHAKIARSAPELATPEASPESRSSSSGFGSKNTSSNPNQSSQSSTFTELRFYPQNYYVSQPQSLHSDWRLPPYRPPPPPPHVYPLPPPPPMVGRWLELAYDSPQSSETIENNHHKAVDVGSVDGHYEFDPSTPTPTPSTPTGGREDFKSLPRLSRYDNIEARVQAMKEEFHEFRKRQAKRRRSHELESVC